jgi:hypothetical protein
MADNPIIAGSPKRGKSPTDPQACCDWANERLSQDEGQLRRWVVTGDPKHPIALLRSGFHQCCCGKGVSLRMTTNTNPGA